MYVGALERWLSALVIGVAVATPVRSQEPVPQLSFAQLACMSWNQLETLYREAPPGTLPTGFVRGRTRACPDIPLAGPLTRTANLVWKGKRIHADGSYVNQWLIGRAIRGQAYLGDSWLDGQPALIFDYADSALFAMRDVRDEMREVAPGLYVGYVYVRRCPTPQRKALFILQTGACASP